MYCKNKNMQHRQLNLNSRRNVIQSQEIIDFQKKKVFQQ